MGKEKSFSIHQADDPIIGVPVYSVYIGGKNRYLYEKMEDVLLRVAQYFEPPTVQKITKPRNVIKVPKKNEKFPLGDKILEILPDSATPAISFPDVMYRVKTNRKFRISVWNSVIGRLVNKGKVKMKNYKGVKYYWKA